MDAQQASQGLVPVMIGLVMVLVSVLYYLKVQQGARDAAKEATLNMMKQMAVAKKEADEAEAKEKEEAAELAVQKYDADKASALFGAQDHIKRGGVAVVGAGTEECNGLYFPAGENGGVGQWRKESDGGVKKHETGGKTFELFSLDPDEEGAARVWWNIQRVHPEGGYYPVHYGSEGRLGKQFPPAHEWLNDRGAKDRPWIGHLPPPDVHHRSHNPVPRCPDKPLTDEENLFWGGILVVGAGSPEVNGQYCASGEYGGAEQYTMVKDGRTFEVFRTLLDDGWWNIQELSPEGNQQLNVHYGSKEVRTLGKQFPPQFSWHNVGAGGEWRGAEPMPEIIHRSQCLAPEGGVLIFQAGSPELTGPYLPNGTYGGAKQFKLEKRGRTFELFRTSAKQGWWNIMEVFPDGSSGPIYYGASEMRRGLNDQFPPLVGWQGQQTQPTWKGQLPVVQMRINAGE
jgi:hypothetical protein